MAESHFPADSVDLTGTIRQGAFVGRQREMAELKAALEDALAGRGGVAMLVGEPGIGKTRTAQELAAYATSQGVEVLWGRCHLSQGTPSYWPWVQAIRSYARSHAPEELRTQMGAGAADICQVVPEVREQLSDLEPPHALEPQQARFRLFDSVTSFLMRASEAHPLLAVLDNIHWADQPSLMLLEFLTQELAACRLLVVGTYRDTELTRQHPLTQTLGELAREPSFRRVPLRGLNQEEVGRFIQAAAGFTPAAELVQSIHSQTEGNPLFLTEVVRLLAQEGKLATGPAESLQTWNLMIPAGVRQVIGGRLDRLSEKCNQALSLASVIGREFDLGLVERLMADSPFGWGTPLSGDEVLEALEEALTSRVIEEVPQTTSRYQFSHVLIQDTLAQELSAARRARLHRRIAEALEGLYGQGAAAHAAELAYHFDQAGAATDTEKLVRYSLLAGEQALASYAYEEALAHFQRGLTARGVEVEGTKQASDEEVAALLFGLGRARAATSERFHTQEAFDALSRAFDFYATTGDVERAVAVAEYPGYVMALQIGVADLQRKALDLVPSHSHEAGRLLSTYGRVLALGQGDYDAAKEAFGHALTIAQRVGDALLEMRTLAQWANVDTFHAHYVEGLDHSLKAIELARQIDAPLTEVEARYYAVTALTNTGHLEGAHQHNTSMLALAERLHDRFWLAGALWKNAIEFRLKGDWRMARQFNERGLSVSPRDTSLLADRVLLEFSVGNFHHAEGYLERLIELMHATPPRATSPYANPAMVIPMASRSTDQVGRLEVAEQAADTVLSSPAATPAMALRARIGVALLAVHRGDTQAAREQYLATRPLQGLMLIWAISADRLLGLLAHTMGDLDQAAEHFEDALIFCRNAGYRPELAWTCHDYADALLQRNGPGDRARATALLDEARSISSELGMRPLMERVVAFQERVESGSGNSRITTTYPDGLTQREAEVLQLIAGGKSNSEIAEELVVSIRTVERHISNIYTKINARHRADAISYVLNHQLSRSP